jgi:type II secretory pathway pseudopilin PulG
MKKAFTLIEVILYLAIAGSMILAIAGFLTVALQARARYQAVSEVGQQGTFIMSVLAQNVRGALAINSPADGQQDSSLSLTVPGAQDNPVVFAATNGTLTETVGSSAAYNLSSGQISVSNLEFSNLSPTGGPGLVRVSFTLAFSGLTNYQANFYDSFNLNP